MKQFLISLILISTAGTLAHATENNSVTTHLSNIQDVVRHCSIVPFTFKNGVKVYHNLLSHCPQVKVLQKGKASVKVGSQTFFITLLESPDSDGDLFHVDIRDYISNDSLVLPNVHAYGDVLLGVLVGDTRGVPKSYFPEGDSN